MNETKIEAVTKVLMQYKKSPCLWNVHNAFYTNKSAREEAFAALLRIWQQYDDSITLPLVKKKLEYLRSSYRREKRKVENSIACGNTYKPSLWYYDYMNFLSGKKDDGSEAQSCSDDDDVDYTQYVQLPRKRQATDSIDSEPQPESSKTVIEASAAAFGTSVGAQLHHLSKVQRCIAEKLISDVIYYGKMEKLSMNSSVNVNYGANQSQQVNTHVGNIVIPETAPSWYDTVHSDSSEQRPSPSCAFIVNEENVEEVNNARNEDHGSADDLDEQRNAIDSIK